MKLEERMYVRFTNSDKSYQYIGKIVNINEFREPSKKNAVYVSWYDDYIFIGDEDIVKASYKLIDLIELGDYVNGYKVYSGGKKHFDYILTWDEQNNYYMKIDLLTVNIKSIVTKEQFNSMKYEVGE